MVLLIAAGLLGMAWMTAHHVPPWVSWHNEIWAFAAVMWLAGALLISDHWKRLPFRLPMVLWPLTLVGAVVLVQLALGKIVFAGDAWVILMYLALALIAVCVSRTIGGEPAQPNEAKGQRPFAHQLAMLLVLGGLWSVAIAVMQSLELWENAQWVARMPSSRRPGANIGQANQLATLLLFSLASLIYLFEAGRLRRAPAIPVALVLLFGLAVTESRTGVLSLLILSTWWLAKRPSLKFAMPLTAGALFLAFFALCLWCWPTWLAHILIQTGEGSLVNLQAGTRLTVWPQLWEAILQKPWFGWGAGAVPEALNAVLHLHPRSENFTYSHNLFLDLAIGMGLPLALLLAGATSVWLWRRMRTTADPLSWYCIAVILPFGIHCLLEFPFAYAYLLVPVMLLVGVLEARAAPTAAIIITRRLAVAVWAVAAGIMGWSLVEYVAVEEDFRIARFEVMQVGQSKFEYDRPKIRLLTQMAALLEGSRLAPQPGMNAERLQLSRAVAMRFPSPATQSRHAVALALNGEPNEALRQLRVMRALYGEESYAAIKARWVSLGEEKYPQLNAMQLP